MEEEFHPAFPSYHNVHVKAAMIIDLSPCNNITRLITTHSIGERCMTTKTQTVQHLTPLIHDQPASFLVTLELEIAGCHHQVTNDNKCKG